MTTLFLAELRSLDVVMILITDYALVDRNLYHKEIGVLHCAKLLSLVS